ncbi:MAG: hypothetical protein ACRD2C_25900 [Acidimicrobiales bacterium]
MPAPAYGPALGLPINRSAVTRAVANAGFAVVAGILTPGEIADARATLLDRLPDDGLAFGDGRARPAAHSYPELAWLFGHPNVVELARATLAADGVAFSGHTDAHLDMRSDWHKDSGSAAAGDRLWGYFGRPCFDDPLEAVKVALYLNDHRDGTDGLRVDPGSHRRPTTDPAQPTVLATAPGEGVVFDVRLTHAGPPPDQPLSDQPRLAVFSTFVRTSRAGLEFAARNRQRQEGQLGVSLGAPCDALLARFARQGIAIA